MSRWIGAKVSGVDCPLLGCSVAAGGSQLATVLLPGFIGTFVSMGVMWGLLYKFSNANDLNDVIFICVIANAIIYGSSVTLIIYLFG